MPIDREYVLYHFYNESLRNSIFQVIFYCAYIHLLIDPVVERKYKLVIIVSSFVIQIFYWEGAAS
jgi:hypothetical protein